MEGRREGGKGKNKKKVRERELRKSWRQIEGENKREIKRLKEIQEMMGKRKEEPERRKRWQKAGNLLKERGYKEILEGKF